MSSDHQGTPPFAGKSSPELRLCSVGGERRARGRSNLTSGPGGPTVSDPAPVHAGVSGSAFPEYAFDVYTFYLKRFSFLFYFKYQILTKL